MHLRLLAPLEWGELLFSSFLLASAAMMSNSTRHVWTRHRFPSRNVRFLPALCQNCFCGTFWNCHLCIQTSLNKRAQNVYIRTFLPLSDIASVSQGVRVCAWNELYSQVESGGRAAFSNKKLKRCTALLILYVLIVQITRMLSLVVMVISRLALFSGQMPAWWLLSMCL